MENFSDNGQDYVVINREFGCDENEIMLLPNGYVIEESNLVTPVSLHNSPDYSVCFVRVQMCSKVNAVQRLYKTSIFLFLEAEEDP